MGLPAQLGEDKAVIQVAARGEKGLQSLALAPGDKVRLFNRVVVDRQHFASNGDTLTVLDANNDAMRVRRDDGTEASVKYDQLRVRRNEPVTLAYGFALTHDAVQGVTSTEHVHVAPDGTRAVDSRKAYVAESRNRDTTWTVINEAAERRQIAGRIPLGTYRPINEADIWRNVGDNLGRAGVADTATQFLKAGSDIRRGSVSAIPKAHVRMETQEREGREPMTHRHTQELHQAQQTGWLHQAADRLQQTLRQAHDVARERLRELARSLHTPRQSQAHEGHRHQQQRGPSLSL